MLRLAHYKRNELEINSRIRTTFALPDKFLEIKMTINGMVLFIGYHMW